MSLRSANKELRKQRIFAAARQMLIAGGYEGLTTRGLADAAGVTVPTIYNLIGGKDDVLAALIIDGTDRVWENWRAPDGPATISAIDDWLATTQRVIGEDADAIRAMILASDHVAGLYAFDAQSPGTVSGASRAIDMPALLCERLVAGGALFGNISAQALGEQVFICFRDPFRDWGQGVISLDEFARRFARGTYMVLCADATDTTRQILVKKIQELEEGAPASLSAPLMENTR